MTKHWLALLGAPLLLFACNNSFQKEKVEFRVPVTVEPVGTGDVEDQIVATGTLRASQVVILRVENAGILEIGHNRDGRPWGEGDRVERGDVIASITGEDARLAARTDTTRQHYESALSEYESSKKLFEEDMIPEAELRPKKTALQDAKLEYDRSLQMESRNQLVSPSGGVILRLARDEKEQPLASGQHISAGFEVARIAQIQELIADIDLVGPDLAKVSVGLKARTRQYAWSDQRFDASVIRLAPRIDPTTRSLRAELAVDNSKGLLRPGMFVEVTIIGERREGVPVIPRQAVSERGGKRVVFVLEGQRVAKREVTLGLGDDNRVEIRQGLQEGERIVVKGLETLTDQTRVRVTGSS